MNLPHMLTTFRIRQMIWSLIALIIALTFAGFLFALGWNKLGPKKVEPSEIRKQLVVEWVPLALSDIRTNRPGLTKAALLHLANDPSDFVTDSLRNGIQASGYLNLVEPRLDEKVARLLNLEVSSPASLSDAFDQAKSLGVPFLLYGRILAFEGTPKEAQFIVELNLAETLTRNVTFTRTYVRNWRPYSVEPALLPDSVSQRSLGQRLLLWALAVLVLPLATIQFLRGTVKQGSNRANFSALAIYTAVDAVIAFLLLGLDMGTTTGTLTAFGLIAGAGFYNLWIMSFALKLES